VFERTNTVQGLDRAAILIGLECALLDRKL
jgi:hypothetical protein